MLAGSVPEHISAPMPLYRVDLDRLAKPGDELPVHQHGWRTLLIGPLGGARAADVRGVEDNFAVARLASGAGIDAMVAAAQEMDKIAGGVPRHDLRIIESEALKVAALWLHGPYGFVRPYLGVPPDHYSEAHFRDVLAKRLLQIRAQYRSASEEDGEPAGV
jgi:hypothetical protein